MNEMIISLGSNMAQGEYNMRGAMVTIEAFAASARFSPIYESDDASAHATPGSPRYKNCVGIIKTPLAVDEWTVRFKQLEREAGRTEAMRRAGCVPLDIDVVSCNGEVLRPKDFEKEYFRRGMEMIGGI